MIPQSTAQDFSSMSSVSREKGMGAIECIMCVLRREQEIWVDKDEFLHWTLPVNSNESFPASSVPCLTMSCQEWNIK